MASILSRMTEGFDDIFEKMAALPVDEPEKALTASEEPGIDGFLDDFNATSFYPEEVTAEEVNEISENHIFLAGSEMDGVGQGADDVILTDEWVREHYNRVTNMYPFMSSGYAEGGIFDPSLFGEKSMNAGCACGHCSTEGAVCSDCGTIAEKKDIEGTCAYIDFGSIPVITGKENILAGTLGINTFSYRDRQTGGLREIQGGQMLRMILKGELYVNPEIEMKLAGVGNFPDYVDGDVFNYDQNEEGTLITGPDAFSFLTRYMDVHMGIINLAESEMRNYVSDNSREKYSPDVTEFFSENREKAEDTFSEIDSVLSMSLETGKGTDAVMSSVGSMDIDISNMEITISKDDEKISDILFKNPASCYVRKMKSGEKQYVRLTKPSRGKRNGYVFTAEKGIIGSMSFNTKVTKDDESALMMMALEPSSCKKADMIDFFSAGVKASLVSHDISERKIMLDRMKAEFGDVVSYGASMQKRRASEAKKKEQGRILMGALEHLEANGISASDLIQHFIIVSPPSVRPVKRAEHASTVEGRLGPLNLAYINTLSTLNSINELVRAGADRDGGSDAYRKMISSLYSDLEIIDKANRELLSGKKGIPRSSIASFYTRDFARGAIIAGPDLGYSEIALPVTLVYSLFRKQVDKKLGELRAEDKTGFWANVDFIEEIKRESPLAVKIVDMAIHGENPDEDPLVMLKRQPVLSNNSLKLAKVKVITGNGVIMNPDFLKALNADHDGDVLSFSPITNPDLIKTAREEMKHQSFSYSNGEMLTIPSNESLLGLYGITAPESELHFNHDTVISGIQSFGEDSITVVSARHVFLRGKGTNPSELGTLKRKGEYLFTDENGTKVYAKNIGTLEEKNGQFVYIDSVSNPDFITVPAGVSVRCRQGDFLVSGTPLAAVNEQQAKKVSLEDVLTFTVGHDKDGYESIKTDISFDRKAESLQLSFSEPVNLEGKMTTPGRISLMYRLGMSFCSQLLADRDRVDVLNALEYYGAGKRTAGFNDVTSYLSDREGFYEVLSSMVNNYMEGMSVNADKKISDLKTDYLKSCKNLDDAIKTKDVDEIENCVTKELEVADALFRRLLAVNVRDMVALHIPSPDYQITKKTINRYYDEFVKMNPLADEETLGIFNREMFKAGFYYADRVPGLTFNSDSVLQLDGFDINEEFKKLGLENGTPESRATAYENTIQPEIVRALESKYMGYANNPIANMIKSGAKGNWSIAASLGVAVGSGRGKDGSVLGVVYDSRAEGISQIESAQTAIDSIRRSEKGSSMGIIGGYFRWMRNLLSDVKVAEDDCHTTECEKVSLLTDGGSAMATGHVLMHPALDEYGNTLIAAGETLTSDRINYLRTNGVAEVEIRTPAHCHCENGICSKCYGTDYHLGPYESKTIEKGRKVGVDAAAAITADISQTSMDKAKQSGPPSRFDPMEKLGTLLKGEDLRLLNESYLSYLEKDAPQKLYNAYLERLLSFVPKGVGKKHLEIVASSMFGVNISRDGKEPGYMVNLRQYNSLKDKGQIPKEAKVRCVYTDINMLIRLLGSNRAMLVQGGKEITNTLTETNLMKKGMENRYNREKSGKGRE